jgi:electron transfer flavoprotein alpha subunit
MSGEARSVLVWSEQPEIAGALVEGASGIVAATGGLVARLDVGAAGAAGDVDLVYRTAAIPPAAMEQLVATICAAAEAASSGLVLIGATKLGLEVAPRVAERLGAGYAAWAVGLETDAAGSVTARCRTYAGSALSTVVFNPGLVVATVAKDETLGAAAAPTRPLANRVVDLPAVEAAASVTVLRSESKPGGAGVDDARVIVDVGQGVREKGDLAMIQELAAVLGAGVACSRPVAADRDWFPGWLGLSGAKVKPDLCLTVGVSGAVQHVVGIRGSRVIAAVDNDAGAAIFAQADVGVVADLYEFVPALIDRLRARRITAASR